MSYRVAVFCTLVLVSGVLAAEPNRLGFYAWDTGTNRVVQQHAKQRFPFCSTAKLMIVGAILKEAMTRPGLEARRIHYTEHFLKQAGYTPVTGRHIKTGMTIAQLCAAAIEYSDSGAANLLIKELGGTQAVTAFARAIGNHTFRLDRWEPNLNTAIPGDPRDTATPYSMAKSLYRLTEGRVLANKQRKQLITWLVHSKTGLHRIRAGLPNTWRVGDKTGSGAYGTTNDIAMIWPPHGQPIVMAIYYTQAKQQAKPDDKVMAQTAHLIVEKLFGDDKSIN